MRDRDSQPAGGRLPVPAVALAMAGAALSIAGCGGGETHAPPLRLLGGSIAPSLPKALAALGSGAVISRVRVLHAAELDARARTCVERFRPEFRIPPQTLVVERTAAIGASLTFVDSGRRVVLGCDRTVRPSANGPWCARSVGRLFAGRLRDARVDILCVDARGSPVGFGWLEPTRGARWIVVGTESPAEVEEVSAGLPVRVSTREVDTARSSATFAVTEYDSAGKEVDRYRLRARVAG
jgi:hypothetical protein